MPFGIKTDLEIFSGFGKKEMLSALVMVLICGIIDLIIYFFTRNTFLSISIIIISVAVSIALFTKDGYTNSSVVDILVRIVRFKKSQKYYPYIYKEERA